MEDTEGDTRKNGLIAANNLNYVLEPDLSVAVNVTYKEQTFQNNAPLTVNSSAARSQCLFNTGADYIDMHKSFLNFQFTAVVPPGSTLNSLRVGTGGSMLNLINRITISSRSGDELTRIGDFNQWCATELMYRYDRNWWETVGSSFYANPGADGANLLTIGGSNQSLDVSIPCYLLSGLFEYPRLLPSMLTSGLRIEIEWAPVGKAFKTTYTGAYTAPMTDYIISNLNFQLRSVQLTDSLQRSLNEQSATNGLEIVYSDIESTAQALAVGSTQLDVEIRKACSRALRASARLKINRAEYREIVAANTPGDVEGPFSSPAASILSAESKQYQWQLGSLYFPHQPVRSMGPGYQGTGSGWTETRGYCDTLANYDCIDRQAHMYPCATLTQYSEHARTICVCLERSSLFNLSGMPINNSRILVLHHESRAPVAGPEPHTCVIHLKYVKLARVFLNNIEVEQ